MLDQTTTNDRAVIEEYLALLTDSQDTEMEWRFLPERGTAEEKRILDIERTERQRLKAEGDPDWRKFAIKRNYTGTLDDVWPALVAHQNGTAFPGQLVGWGIFCVIGEGGRNAKSITRVRALFVDGDGIPLPAKWHVQPTFITVRDELHWHAYWLVPDCPVGAFEEAQKRLIAYYHSDPAVHDLPRVMRVPGTLHQKAAAIPIKLVPMDWEHHALAELMEGLPEITASEGKASLENEPAGSPEGWYSTDARRREVLAWINPEPYDDWFDALAALHGSYPTGDPDRDVGGRALAHEFSMGLLDRFGRLPGNYDADAVDEKWDSFADKPGAAHFGKLVTMAKAAGCVPSWGEPPRDNSRTAEEVFPEMAAAAESERETGDESLRGERFEMLEPYQFKDRPPARYAIETLVRDKGIHICYGRSEAVKTFEAVDLCGSIITGIPAFNHYDTYLTGDAVFFCAEDPDEVMTQRWPAWCHARGIEDPFGNPFPAKHRLFTNRNVPLVSDPSDVDAAIRQIRSKKAKPRIVVWDTASMACGGLDQDDIANINLLFGAAHRFRQAFGCAVWIIDHPNKHDWHDLRGSGGKTNNADVVWESVRQGTTLNIQLINQKMKGVPRPAPITLRGRTITVPGLLDQKGRQITVPVFDAVEQQPLPESAKVDLVRQAARELVEETFARYGIHTRKDAKGTNYMASLMAGVEPRDRTGDEWHEWNDRRITFNEQLKNGSGKKGHKLVYDGLFIMGSNTADDDEHAKRSDKVKLWYPIPKEECK